MDHPKSGLPDFGHFKYASRINPTCDVKPAGDASSELDGRETLRAGVTTAAPCGRDMVHCPPWPRAPFPCSPPMSERPGLRSASPTPPPPTSLRPPTRHTVTS